ncbi:hypothetical protein BKA62DRAFT_834668 [Auriculariales sp. MPI-PUGE-AT-0066]|nr:hypothetical protein BKA62DRAFT_834668 [Auriculariales sp. MPI-PUGE-AT-0066]
MPAKYDLLYFPMLKYASTVKTVQLFGKVPRLTVTESDGKETSIWESRAINEYLAVQLGFLPKNDELERSHLNSFACSVYEITDKVNALQTHATPEERKAYWTRLLEIVPERLKWHERYLASKTDGPFYAGDKITLPDIVLYVQWTRWTEMFPEDAIINNEATPNLLKLVETCHNGPVGEIVQGWADVYQISDHFDDEKVMWLYS